MQDIGERWLLNILGISRVSSLVRVHVGVSHSLGLAGASSLSRFNNVVSCSFVANAGQFHVPRWFAFVALVADLISAQPTAQRPFASKRTNKCSIRASCREEPNRPSPRYPFVSARRCSALQTIDCGFEMLGSHTRYI